MEQPCYYPLLACVVAWLVHTPILSLLLPTLSFPLLTNLTCWLQPIVATPVNTPSPYLHSLLDFIIVETNRTSTQNDSSYPDVEAQTHPVNCY